MRSERTSRKGVSRKNSPSTKNGEAPDVAGAPAARGVTQRG